MQQQRVRPRLRLEYDDDHVHTAEELVGTRRVPMSLRSFRSQEKRGEGPRRVPLTNRTYGYLERDIKQWLEQRAMKETMPSKAASEDAAELAPQIRQALRCWMNGDHAGWGKTINGSRFPVRVFVGALSNVVAKLAAEADDEERFLDLVAEIVARD